MQNRFGLLVADVMPIYMIIPRYSHNYAQFYQLLDSNSFTHRNTYALERTLVKPMAPGSIFHHINIPILSYFLCRLFYFASLFLFIIKLPIRIPSRTSFAQYFSYILKHAPVILQDFWSCAEYVSNICSFSSPEFQLPPFSLFM